MSSKTGPEPSYEIALLEHYITDESYQAALEQYLQMVQAGIKPGFVFQHLANASPPYQY